MKDYKTGKCHTAHTTNPVPFVLACPATLPPRKLASKVKLLNTTEHGSNTSEHRAAALCDVAPTVLHLMGLDVPVEMTGHSLLL